MISFFEIENDFKAIKGNCLANSENLNGLNTVN